MMTRMLIQKPAQYAELEENARIAVSVLQDDGWCVERIDDMMLQVTTQPVIVKAEDPRLVQAREALEAADARFMVLRNAVARDLGYQWFAAAGAFGIAWLMNYIHAAAWCGVLAAICIALGRWHRRRYSKGAK